MFQVAIFRSSSSSSSSSSSIRLAIITVLLLLLLLPILFTGNRVFARADSDEHLTFAQFIESRGYRLREYRATTADGYIITIHRVVPRHDFDEVEYSKTRKPVIAFHGIVCQSPVFYYNSASHDSADNFGFAMLRTGRYDVWVPNARGNGMSNEHVRLDPRRSAEYWKFSFEQIGLQDIPAFIDLVLAETGHQTVGYVGYSQGAGSLFALLSVRPEFARKIEPFISWAPAVYLRRAKTLIRGALHLSYSYMHKHAGEFELTDYRFNQFSQNFCRRPLTSMVCAELLASVFGPSNRLNRTRLPVYTHFSPSPCSRWQVVHYVQLGQSGRFARFDHHERNQEIYGQDSPPDFPLQNYPKNLTTIIMYGRSDWFVDQLDVLRLIGNLRLYGSRNVIDYVVPLLRWNHYDFLAGMGAGAMVYDRTIQYLDRFVRWP